MPDPQAVAVVTEVYAVMFFPHNLLGWDSRWEEGGCLDKRDRRSSRRYR